MRLSVHLVSLGSPAADLPKLRPLLRISISKWNLRRNIWFLVNYSLCIAFSTISLAGCIIQRDALMLKVCFTVVASLWIMYMGTYRFDIKLHSVPMRPLSLSYSMNAMFPTMEFAFRCAILFTSKYLWMH